MSFTVSFIKLVKKSVFLSSVSCSIKLIKQGFWNLLSVSGWLEAQGTAWDLQLASGVGGRGPSCRTEPLTGGIWCCLWADKVRIELSAWTPCWLRTAWCHAWETLTCIGVGCGNLKGVGERTQYLLRNCEVVRIEWGNSFSTPTLSLRPSSLVLMSTSPLCLL